MAKSNTRITTKQDIGGTIAKTKTDQAAVGQAKRGAPASPADKQTPWAR